MSSFDEIEVQQGLVGILAPLLKDYLGVLKNPDGTESTQPAIYLGGNFVPESTLPRIILNYQGSTTGGLREIETRTEDNPDYDSSDPDSQEYLYYLDRNYHLEYIISFTIDSGDMQEVLTGSRKSSAYIARYLRKLLQTDDVRKSIHTECLSGVNYIAPETSISSLSGVNRVDGSNILINFTTQDTFTEQQYGFVEGIDASSSTELYSEVSSNTDGGAGLQSDGRWFYPIDFTEDPTYAFCPARSTSGYKFISNEGIYTNEAITDMSEMFSGKTSFNSDIATWDVSSVEDMNCMFEEATIFNQDLSSWDLSSVKDTDCMFLTASSFNQPVDTWDVSKVTDMSAMFEGASSFNQPINTWDVSNVINMGGLFSDAVSFNQDLYNWDVSSVEDMQYMFNGATLFNKNISLWEVSNVSRMVYMFNNATSFNQDLTGWDVSLIAELPENFADGSSLEESNYPIWGTNEQPT